MNVSFHFWLHERRTGRRREDGSSGRGTGGREMQSCPIILLEHFLDQVGSLSGFALCQAVLSHLSPFIPLHFNVCPTVCSP